MRKWITLLPLLLLSGCAGIPKGITPVKNFDLPRYLGTWHEIARLDHSFERGLVNVTAEYAMREDGGVSVVNRGFSPEKGIWKQAEGKAYFIGDPTEGRLKVSFFGPFYGAYNIFELDQEGYETAYVCGPNHSYLWFLSRSPSVTREQINHFLLKARALGFNTRNLIFPGTP